MTMMIWMFTALGAHMLHIATTRRANGANEYSDTRKASGDVANATVR